MAKTTEIVGVEVWYSREFSYTGENDWYASGETYSDLEAAKAGRTVPGYDHRVVRKTLTTEVMQTKEEIGRR